MSSNRGAEPNPKTKMELFARAAGRCQFAGCNKWLFNEELTCASLNASNIAHIIASSPDGPRGNESESHLMANDIKNLMLVCRVHHKLIDDRPDEYTSEILRNMKETHESAISRACNNIAIPETMIIRLISPIKGVLNVSIDYGELVKALNLEKAPCDMCGMTLNISDIGDYRTNAYWKQVIRKINAFIKVKIDSLLEEEKNMHLSIFPLAPIPMIIYFGYALGDKNNCDVFQKKRYPDTWKWVQENQTNDFVWQKEIKRQGSKIAIIVELSDCMAERQVMEVYDADILYRIKAKRIGVDCLESKADLAAFWHVYQEVCSDVKDLAERTEVALFPAIPVSAAFEIGRRYMKGVYPIISIYDNDNGFFKTIEIGGEFND